MPFEDRRDAGRRLAAGLAHLREPQPVVLGIVRGGVPVGFEVAQALGAPLDVMVVRKLGVPFQPELGMGAIGENGARVLNDDVIREAAISPQQLAAVEERERRELEERVARFRRGRPGESLDGRTVIVVDDGIATGSTAKAACQVARALGASRVVLAVPVLSPSVIEDFTGAADEVVYVDAPTRLWSVGQWYRDFSQTSDSEVVDLLRRASLAPFQRSSARRDEDVEIQLERVQLAGHLSMLDPASGVVVFAHGTGSSRHSPRNRHVAAALNAGHISTLLLDLLTDREELDRANVFDVALLGRRLEEVTSWVRARPELAGLPVGYFGASTGAGAALWAAGAAGAEVAAVVSRGGRPDLAGERLGRVRAPVLLIVGARDPVVVELNREAQQQLRCDSRLEVVGGATHLFEEAGALDSVASLAREWFTSSFMASTGNVDPGEVQTTASGEAPGADSHT